MHAAVLNRTPPGADREVVFLVNGELAGRVLVPPPLRRCKLSLAVQPYMGGVALLCDSKAAAPESDSRSKKEFQQTKQGQVTGCRKFLQPFGPGSVQVGAKRSRMIREWEALFRQGQGGRFRPKQGTEYWRRCRPEC